MIVLGARIGAVALALAAGYCFGSTTPSWEEDRFNEREPWSQGDRLNNSDPTGMYSGYGSSLPGSIAQMRLGCAESRLGASLCALAGIVCAVLGWDSAEHQGHVAGVILFHPGFWSLLGGAGVGYVLAIVTGKGIG
jgi:hypothetical protein